ncbi:hypothetical protein DPMN_152210 [Dreissena polymorpha]|uniref:Uncharacterized protein n=1 Tax=Dreissena polymorpha TaxID=45954 RepID=A0A9D4FH26_DREPO|nr:hypothetical protein DPMN_152210 [Dreissena polymorpha]
MTILSRLWTSITISYPTKQILCKSLVISKLPLGCETWTLHSGTDRMLQELNTSCYDDCSASNT